MQKKHTGTLPFINHTPPTKAFVARGAHRKIVRFSPLFKAYSLTVRILYNTYTIAQCRSSPLSTHIDIQQVSQPEKWPRGQSPLTLNFKPHCMGLNTDLQKPSAIIGLNSFIYCENICDNMCRELGTRGDKSISIFDLCIHLWKHFYKYQRLDVYHFSPLSLSRKADSN